MDNSTSTTQTSTSQTSTSQTSTSQTSTSQISDGELYFKTSSILALVVLFISIAMIIIIPLSLPWSPPGLNSPILAFEFISNIQEAKRLFGTDKVGLTPMIESIYWDFFYITSYCLFLTSVAFGAWAHTRNKNFLLCLPFILLAGMSDIFENSILLDLGDKISNDQPGDGINFDMLRLWVNSKFTALTMILTLLIPFMRINTKKLNRHRRFVINNRIFTGCVCFAVPCSLSIWFTRQIAPEILVLMIAIGWVSLALRAFHFSRLSRL